MEGVELALKTLEPWRYLVLDGDLVDFDLLFLYGYLERVELELLVLNGMLERMNHLRMDLELRDSLDRYLEKEILESVEHLRRDLE